MSYHNVRAINTLLEQMAHKLEPSGCMHDNEFDKQIEAIIESDDYSDTPAIAACGPLADADIVELAIQQWIGTLKAAGYQEDADNAVFDALAFLIEKGVIPDCPDVDDPGDQKDKWVFLFHRAIHAKLVEFGLEF